jgi:hypothetical protein
MNNFLNIIVYTKAFDKKEEPKMLHRIIKFKNKKFIEFK